MVYQMALFSMILNDPKPIFQSHAIRLWHIQRQRMAWPR